MKEDELFFFKMGKKYEIGKWRFRKPLSLKILSHNQYNIMSSLQDNLILFLRKHYDVQTGPKKEKINPNLWNLNEFEKNLSYIKDNARSTLFYW